MAKKKDEHLAAKELRERPAGELNSMLATKVEELFKARTKLALGQLRTTHEITALRRDVARLKTVLNEQQKKTKSGSAA
jgi:large subunit ribosomal protein L29